MAEQFENNYSTLLNGAIDSDDTTITVDAAPVNMTGSFRIKIDDEIILVGAVSGLTFTGCTRGVEDTTAASHSDNATVTHVLTAEALTTAIGERAQGFIGVSVHNTSTSLTSGTPTILTWPDEHFDTDGFHSTSADTSRLTVPAGLGGKYLITAIVGVINQPSTSLDVEVMVNGAAVQFTRVASANFGTGSITVILDLASTNYVEIRATSNTTTLTAANGRFSMVKLDSGNIGQGIGARAYNSTTQNIADSSFVPVLFDSEDFDTDGFHSTSSNTSRLTIPPGLGGKYLLNGGTWWDTNANLFRYGWWRKNGTTDVSGSVVAAAGNASGATTNTTVIVNAVSGDYFEFVVYQNSGSTRTIGGSSPERERSYVEIMRLDSGNIPTTYPMPQISNRTGVYAGSGTSVVATMTAPVAGANMVAVVYSLTRACNSITQTNVTWTQRYAGNGNGMYISVWTGVVAASAGTTATAAFTGSDQQYIETYEVIGAPVNFTSASALNTGTASSGTITGCAAYTMVRGNYIIIASGGPVSSSYSMASHSYTPVSAGGGIARSGILRANTEIMEYIAIQSTSNYWFAAIVRIS